MRSFPRLLLAIAALLEAFGAVVHGMAFRKAVAALAASNLAPFFASSLKTFWLNDSADAAILAAIFALFAARPRLAARPVILLLALMPASICALLYVFLGNFVAVPLMAAITALVVVAGLFWPSEPAGTTTLQR